MRGPQKEEDCYSKKAEDGVEEARRWGAVMIFGDANLKSSFA
jgi:hypothetical protein